jgi:ATP-binding cassette subfamily B (MDR/TAP) protein 1
LCASLATEVNLIQALSGEAMGRNVLFICTVAAAFTFAFTFGYWAIVLVSLATVPIMVSGMAIEIAMMSGGTDGQGSQGLGVDAGKIVGEVVTSVRTIASFTLEQRMSERFTAATDAYLRTNTLSGALKGVYQAYAQFSLFAAFALLYWFGGSKVADGTTDFEGMLIPIFCMFMLGAGLGQAGNGATDAAKAASAAERVFETVDRQSQIDFTSQEGRTLPQVSGDISLKNIKFAYPARPDKKVCNGYSLEIAAGTTVALVGASGSGKSTIIQLMERFYDPDSGVVTLDGVDLRELNVRWLRQQIGLVGQEPVLFSGTIAENIAYGKPGSTPADVEQAARMANAWDFIQEFPAKFDTDVGEKGGQLSGGQKQRIAIARAMIKNPAVLLLDEATSALDTESERIVQGALDELLAKYKRTTIVIAHRLSTIRNADKIAVVDKGKIVEEGTHDELMDKGPEGKYFSLNNQHS